VVSSRFLCPGTAGNDDWPQFVREIGFDDAKFLVPSEIVTAPWVAMKCRFGCGNYGKNLQCPPNTINWSEMKDIQISSLIPLDFEKHALDMNIHSDPWPILRIMILNIQPDIVMLSFRNLDPLAGIKHLIFHH
jgi:hypothetical protein